MPFETTSFLTFPVLGAIVTSATIGCAPFVSTCLSEFGDIAREPKVLCDARSFDRESRRVAPVDQAMEVALRHA